MTAAPLTLFNEVFYVRFGWWLLFVPVLCWWVLLSPWTIFKRREGRRQRAVGLTRKIGRCLLFTAALYYAQAGFERATASECWTEGPSPDGLYKVEICISGGTAQDADYEGIARLRSTAGGTLLAEAEFFNPSLDQVYWDKNYVTVGTGDGMAHISSRPHG
jgi:hypothetical protein